MKKSYLIFAFCLFLSDAIFTQNLPIQFSTTDLATKTSLAELLDFKTENCPIFQVHFIVVPADKINIVETINKGNELQSYTLDLFQKVEKGTKIYVEKIDSLGDCIEFQFRDPNFVIEVI